MKLNTFFKGMLVTTLLAGATIQAKPLYIASTAIVEHPALDAVRDGVKEVLKEYGYDSKKLKFTYESAQGKPDIAVQIARKMQGEKPDLSGAESEVPILGRSLYAYGDGRSRMRTQCGVYVQA